jgi:hypothetical protein
VCVCVDDFYHFLLKSKLKKLETITPPDMILNKTKQ